MATHLRIVIYFITLHHLLFCNKKKRFRLWQNFGHDVKKNREKTKIKLWLSGAKYLIDDALQVGFNFDLDVLSALLQKPSTAQTEKTNTC